MSRSTRNSNPTSVIQPPLLAVWGLNTVFLPPGAEAFRRDIPGGDIRFVEKVNSALETDYAEIAAAIRDIYGSNGGSSSLRHAVGVNIEIAGNRKRMSGSLAIVTGASQGIGRWFGRTFGAIVLATQINVTSVRDGSDVIWLSSKGGNPWLRFDAYCSSFPNARLTRSKTGVLEVALHTDGGTLVFDGHTHEQFVDLFHAIGSDRDNRVVILTGSGEAFVESISPEGFDFFTPQGYDKIYREGKKSS